MPWIALSPEGHCLSVPGHSGRESLDRTRTGRLGTSVPGNPTRPPRSPLPQDTPLRLAAWSGPASSSGGASRSLLSESQEKGGARGQVFSLEKREGSGRRMFCCALSRHFTKKKISGCLPTTCAVGAGSHRDTARGHWPVACPLRPPATDPALQPAPPLEGGDPGRAVPERASHVPGLVAVTRAGTFLEWAGRPGSAGCQWPRLGFRNAGLESVLGVGGGGSVSSSPRLRAQGRGEDLH